MDVKTTYGKEVKHYDQIAWFRGKLNLPYTTRGGSINFVDAVFQDLTARQMSFRVSDHFQLWAEFRTDRSTEKLACILGQNPGMENALDVVPD